MEENMSANDKHYFLFTPQIRQVSQTCVFIFFGLMLGAVYRIILRRLGFGIPNTVFMLLTGVGLGRLKISWNFLQGLINTVRIDPLGLLGYFLPAFLFKTAFCIDPHTLLKSLSQILIISLLGAIINTALVGTLLYYVLTPNEPYNYIIYIGIFTTGTYPLETINILRDIGYQTKHVICLLEGECMAGLAILMTAYNINRYFSDYDWKDTLIFFSWHVGFGLVLAFAWGRFTRIVVSYWYNNPLNLLLITLAYPYLTAYICEQLIGASSAFTVIAIGIFMCIERPGFPVNVDYFLLYFWELLASIMHTMVLLTLGFYIDEIFFAYTYKEYLSMLVSFMVATAGRTVTFIALIPILSRVGYGFTFRDAIVMTLGGLRVAVPCVLACTLTTVEIGHDNQAPDKVFLNICAVYLLNLLIHGPSLKRLFGYMGLGNVPPVRQTNMNNCMKILLTNREKAIITLKMDRFLSDANWPLVNDTTLMKHPYKSNKNSAEVDREFGIDRISVCPVCHIETIRDFTEKEMVDLLRGGKIRALKSLKISFSKQYELGVLSKEGIRVLSAMVEEASESKNASLNLAALFRLFRKKNIVQKLRSYFYEWWSKKKSLVLRPPRRSARRFCYYIIVHPFFEQFMHIVVILNMIPMILDVTIRNKPNFPPGGTISLVVLNLLFVLIYLAECIIKILGYSWIYIWKHGVKTYFGQSWNIFDFVILLAAILDICLDFTDLFLNHYQKTMGSLHTFIFAIKFLRLLRLVRLFQLNKSWTFNIVKFLDLKVDNQMAFAYEVGKSYVAGVEEILDSVSLFVEPEEIQIKLKSYINETKSAITRELGMIQKDMPWIAINVKSKQAMRITLNSMKESIDELKSAGFLDDFEYSKLVKSVQDKLKEMKRISNIPPNKREVIFKEVNWLCDDEGTADFLYCYVESRALEAGEHLYKEGEQSDGVYIIISGLLQVCYTPSPEVIRNCHLNGALPVIEYIMNPDFSHNIEDYLVSGNTLGELSTLKSRPYNCNVFAETHTELYFIPKDIILSVIQQDVDQINGLESRIWKAIALRLALAILMEIPTYQSQNVDGIKIALERSFIPKLNNFKVFVVCDMIQDLVLIEGIVKDYSTEEIYRAPCYIRRTCQKIVFPSSSIYTLRCNTEVKLLIIPLKDMDEYELMEKEESISDLISDISLKGVYPSLLSTISKVKRRPKTGYPKKMAKKRSMHQKSYSSKYSKSPGESNQLPKILSTDSESTVVDYFYRGENRYSRSLFNEADDTEELRQR